MSAAPLPWLPSVWSGAAGSRPKGSLIITRSRQVHPGGHRGARRFVRVLGAAALVVSLVSLAVATPASAQVPATGGGSWSVVPSPNPSNADPFNILSSVTCVSDADCWAVGSGFDISTDSGDPVIEQWNGSTWSTVPSPATSGVGSLRSVTCLSGTDCWAVGETIDPGAGEYASTLTEQWDGSEWSVVPSPNGTIDGYLIGTALDSVACASLSDCWAVGYTNSAPGEELYGSVIEQWNGSAWSVEHADISGESLNSVACVNDSDCWTVGTTDAGDGQTLIEQWNGSTWSTVTSPNAGPAQSNTLQSVECSMASDCWAVGDYVAPATKKTQIDHSLAEHWDGSAWSIVASPSLKAEQSNGLYSVTCTSSTNCWAVGTIFSSSRSPEQTLAEYWNGSVWALASSADGSATDSNLAAVGCADALDCWSVGSTSSGGDAATLIEQLDPPTVVVSPGAGPPGTALSVHGSGFTFGKRVKVTYLTGSPSGKQSTNVCSATASDTGTFSCGGTVPAARKAGPNGHHTIEAAGPRSLVVASTTFTLS